MNVTTKSGQILTGRPAELYSGNCPPERPCRPEDTEYYRHLYDQPPPPPGTPPPVRTALMNFAEAMAFEAMWRARGGRAPSAEEKQQRRLLCDQCTRRDPEKDMCTPCGCYLEAGLMPLRPLGKLDCATQACPIGLWSYTGGYVPKSGCGGCGSAPKT